PRGVPLTYDQWWNVVTGEVRRGPWMVPERWAFVDRIARTSVEKADKAEVRARLARGEYDVVTLDDTGTATGGTAPGTDDPVRST
ncbi:long-chain fatty acid--CoA ligase, partial [Corynebacterium bovis]